MAKAKVWYTLSIHRLLFIFSQDEDDDKIRWKEAEVWWKWRAEKNEMAMLSIPLSETRFSLSLRKSQTRRDWCFSSNQRPSGSLNQVTFPFPLTSPLSADPARVDTSPLITWCEHCDIKINKHIHIHTKKHTSISRVVTGYYRLIPWRVIFRIECWSET